MTRPSAGDEAPAAPSGTRLGDWQLLDVLGRGTSAVVHRARHVGSGALAALKYLHVDDPSDLESLRREIDILGRLRHPGIVRVLGHGVAGGVPWYAMELVEGPTLDAIWARRPAGDGDVAAALATLRRLCLTLAFLHGEGLVHRDLKPANVVVRADGTPVVVDFGFAATFAARGGREVLERGGELLGSIAYMAPEQVRGEFVDARADLYALGCMLYEAISGAPPFAALTPWEVVRAKLAGPPPAPAWGRTARDAVLERTILALLAPLPRDRPGYAEDVARLLAGSDGVASDAPAASAYLYRAAFVGRETALAQLGACLDRAGDGQAGCALIAGESGVGKTRLAMELTRTAAARRVAVATGECLPPGAGGGPLHPLRPLLRQLADALRAGSLPVAAPRLAPHVPVLAPVEPALAALPGHDADAVPPLPAAAAGERLVRAAVAALAAWASEGPRLLVLDDLQWADELTLAALALFVDSPPAATLLVVGTLRSDEAPPALRGLAAHARVTPIALGRIDRDAVGTMVADMLAMHPPPPRLVDLLRDQSEGNPFYVSEYLLTAVGAGLLVRAMSGGWQVRSGEDAYSGLGLPGRVRALVERRLADLGAAGRALVDAAAVLGREFEPEVAAALAALDAAQLVGALAELRARQVADAAAGGRWRFAHDTLREVAYDVLAATRRRTLHAEAAAALAATANDPTAVIDLDARVAHHLDAAGDPAGAAPHHGRAGERAIADGALEAARAHLQAALHNAPADTPARLRGRWWRLLAEAAAGTDLATAVAATTAALRTLGETVPHSAAGWAVHGLAQLLRRRRPAADQAAASEAAQASNRAATSFYFQFAILPGVASSLRCVRLAAAAGEPQRAALAFAQLGYIAGGARLHRLARYCFARTHALQDQAVDPSEYAAGLYFHAMYETGFGRWAASRSRASEAVQRLRAIGNHQEAEVAATVLANALFYAGALREAERCAAEVQTSADARGHAQHGAWGEFLQGRSRLALGDIAAARPLLERGYARLLPTRDFVSLVMCEGLLAKARWADGDAAAAAAAADSLTARLAERRIVPLAQCLDGYGALADVRLRLWAACRDSARADDAAAAVRALRRFAHLYPIAAPAAARAAARRAWLRGRPRAARREWARSARLASQLNMPFDEALAQLDLAHLAADGERRARARAHLDALGCAPTTADLEAGTP